MTTATAIRTIPVVLHLGGTLSSCSHLLVSRHAHSGPHGAAGYARAGFILCEPCKDAWDTGNLSTQDLVDARAEWDLEEGRVF